MTVTVQEVRLNHDIPLIPAAMQGLVDRRADSEPMVCVLSVYFLMPMLEMEIGKPDFFSASKMYFSNVPPFKKKKEEMIQMLGSSWR